MKIDSRLSQYPSATRSKCRDKKSRPAALGHLSHGQHNADGCTTSALQIAGQWSLECQAMPHPIVYQGVMRLKPKSVHRSEAGNAYKACE
jgi:hypothetical protein